MPHAGAMMLLGAVDAWDEFGATCRAWSHLDATNPLRRRGRLAAVCGVEYGLQAAALHGALCAGGVAQAAGYAASLRGVVLHVDRLDDPAFAALLVAARCEAQERFGMVYAFEVRACSGRVLVAGRASIALPR